VPRIPIRPFPAALVLIATASAVLTCTGASFAGQPPDSRPPQSSGPSSYAAATEPVGAARVLPAVRAEVAPPPWLRRPPAHSGHPHIHRFTTPREIGRHLAAERGWVGEQWTCLDELWTRESNWHVHSENASSGAYGIPQSLPAHKMAVAGSNWRDDAVTQIRWGLSYISAKYGAPCNAWDHSQQEGYY
jgi:hypothetical protein